MKKNYSTPIFSTQGALHHLARIAAVLVTLQGLSACESLGVRQDNNAAAAAAPSATQIYARPAERALINGLRLYEDGVFERAESAFKSALTQGLRDKRDAATAHKYLAFIACAFNRPAECEQNFVAAINDDPGFRLSDAEVGHPIWGPVYRRVTTRKEVGK